MTNFAKKTPVYLDVCRHGRLETVDLFLDYKAQLKAFSSAASTRSAAAANACCGCARVTRSAGSS